MDSDEDNDTGSSWISFKSLKRAADIKSSYQKRQQSPSVSSYASISSESVANPAINPSLSFSSVHKKYAQADLTALQTQIAQLQQQIRYQEEHWQEKYRVMESYYKETERLKGAGQTGRWSDHVDCQAEIETLKATAARQETVIDSLQNTVDSLHEKIAEAQQSQTSQGRNRRRANLSSLQ